MRTHEDIIKELNSMIDKRMQAKTQVEFWSYITVMSKEELDNWVDNIPESVRPALGALLDRTVESMRYLETLPSE